MPYGAANNSLEQSSDTPSNTLILQQNNVELSSPCGEWGTGQGRRGQIGPIIGFGQSEFNHA
jgi:hypothetical protein